MNLGEKRASVWVSVCCWRDFQRVPREGQTSPRAADSGSEEKRNKKTWMCLKMLHHVCLIPFCIIDMILAKWFFFKRLNNLLLSVTSACPRPGQPPPFLLFSGARGPFALESHSRRDVSCVVDQEEETVWSRGRGSRRRKRDQTEWVLFFFFN